MKKIIDAVKKYEQEFTEIRHQLHRQPEIGFEETQTSDFIAEKLQSWGYEVYRGLAKTGIIGTLKQGNGTKVIGLRSDIDALPIIEASGKEWTSQVKGRFHGCGHDGHMTMLLCAAKHLAETRQFDGTLHLIFQPAEELLYGGKVMLDDGLFEHFPCDIIFGLHNMPGLKMGEFYFKEGAIMASSDTIHIEITGIGAHGAMPEKGIDATIVACYIGIALQTIVSRNITPFQPAVVTIGAIQSGEAPNIVNDKALMKLTVRALDTPTRQLMLENITKIATNQAAAFGASVDIKHINGCPILFNGKDANSFAVGVATSLFGGKKIHPAKPMMGSEDFAFMAEKNSNACYAFIGNGKEPGYCNIHNPGYDFNDQCIVPGAAYWVAITEAYLKKAE